MPIGMSGHKALDTSLELDGLLSYIKNYGLDHPSAQYLKSQIETRIARWQSEMKEARKSGYSTGGSANDDMAALADYYNRRVKNAVAADIKEKPPGRMYEVSINADPEHFLDWDKPLSEQSEHVKKALANVKSNLVQSWLGMEDSGGARGQNVYEAISGNRGDEFAAGNLRQAGILGIKYLDQGSRTAGGGSSNYVVFDDKLIDILKKYGLAGVMGGGAAADAIRRNLASSGDRS